MGGGGGGKALPFSYTSTDEEGLVTGTRMGAGACPLALKSPATTNAGLPPA